MTSSTKSWMHDITCTLNDNVKEHIRANHMYPREQGKSCFLSTCDTTVWKRVEETFLNSDVETPHRSDENRIVLQKKFSSPAGVHGSNGTPCFFFDRDLRQFEPKNSYCISNMNFHSLVLNLRRFLFLGKIQRFESINNYIILHFCQVKSAMRTNLTSRLSQRFMVAPATRTGSRQASESLFSSNN